MLTQKDLVRGFRTLELCEEDVAFLHSALSSFGYVDGGAETVVRAFLEVLGDGGTLSVPIFGRYFQDGPDQVWDRDGSVSLMGKITETVRTWPGAYRSLHAIHPVAAVGGGAQDVADRAHETDFDRASPFQRLLDLDAWIVLIGVTYQNCTMIHMIEERLEVPYRRWVELSGRVVDGAQSERKTYRFLKRYPGVSNDFMPIGERLEAEGKVRIEQIGESTVRCFKARDLVDVGMTIVREDPLFLVSGETQKEAARYL